MRKPYKYQEEVIERVKDMPFAMLNMACGVGKTLTAIHIALHKNRPTLIIAPKAVLSSWKDELMEDGVDEKDIWVYTAENKRKTGEEKYLKELNDWLYEG